MSSNEPSKGPPKMIRLSEVPRHVRITKHVDGVTRQTVYNWVRKGVHGEKLKAKKVGHYMVTTKEWVDAFLNRLESIRPL